MKFQAINRPERQQQPVVNSFQTVDDCYRFLQRHFIERDTQMIADVHMGKMTETELLGRAKAKLIELEAPEEIIDETIVKFNKRIFGYGEEIDALLDDDDVSDIRILGPNEIYYKKKGLRDKANTHFAGDREYLDYFNLVATKNEKNVGAFNASQTFTDIASHKDFRLRISLTTTFLTTDEYPIITIRKVPKVKRSEEYFLNAGLFDEESLHMVKDLAKRNASVLVVGEGGSGKTTLINYAMDSMPRQKAVLVVQENEEIYRNPNIEQEVMCLHTVSVNNTNGESVKYDLRPLIAKGLTQDINTFIIGETKGAEAYDYIIALNSGTASWTSAHANSIAGGVEKMVMLSSCAPEGKMFSRQDYMRMFCDLDAVIFMQDYKVQEIAEPLSYDRDADCINFNTLYKRGVEAENNNKLTEG